MIEALTYSLSRAAGISREEIRDLFNKLKLKISPTPSPELGDYGVALHYILHRKKLPRDEWSVFGRGVVEALMTSDYRDRCYIVKAEFTNGYLNIWIDYSRIFRDYADYVLTGRLFEELKSRGRGRRVVVEHTSANPIHPLHVGSGRNTVIGSTFANLLRKLGYDVREHFYVDDMGRQVAVLVYGVSLLSKNGVEPSPDRKIDHWYGIVYALTNILIEKGKLEKKLVEEAARIHDVISGAAEKLLGLYEVNGLAPIYELHVSFKNASWKKRYIHDLYQIIRKLDRLLAKTLKRLSDEESRDLMEIADWFRRETSGFLEDYREYMEYVEAENRLRILEPSVYGVLSEEIIDPLIAEEAIGELMRKYEEEDPIVSELFRKTASDVLEGFRETLGRIGVVFDEYDWESSREIRGLTRHVLEKALSTPYVVLEDNAVILDLDKAASMDEYVRKLFGGEEPGRFVLRRSDGTTLYGTRDVAYSIYKFEKLGAEKVYNVIAHEQAREQKQVKAALHLLGYHEYAEKLVHLDYEMVNLKGFSMSSRRGRIYTLDELIDDYVEVVVRDYLENKIRGVGGLKYRIEDIEEFQSTAEKLAVANTRALLLSIDPRKTLAFDPSKLQEHLEGSWILYTYVRLQSILRKHYGYEPLEHLEEIGRDLIDKLGSVKEVFLEKSEKELLESLLGYQETLLTVEESLETNKLLEKAMDICMKANKFYEELPVLSEKDRDKRITRLILVALTMIILKELLEIMKLPKLKVV